MSGYAGLSLNFDANNQLIPKAPPPPDAPTKAETKKDDSLRFKPASLSGSNRPKPKPKAKPIPKPLPPVVANAASPQESDGSMPSTSEAPKANDPPAGNKRPATLEDWMSRPGDAETVQRYNEQHRPSKKVKRERERERELERQKPKQLRQIDKYDNTMQSRKYLRFHNTELNECIRKQWPSHLRRGKAVGPTINQKEHILSDTPAAADTRTIAVKDQAPTAMADVAAKTRANVAAAIAKIKLQQLEKSAAAQAAQSTAQAVPPPPPPPATQGADILGQQFVPPPPPPPPPRDFIPPPPPARYSHTISSGPLLTGRPQQPDNQTGFVPPPPPSAPVSRVPYSPTISAGPVLIQRPSSAHDAVGSVPPPPPVASTSRVPYSPTISAGPVLIQRPEQFRGQAGSIPSPPPALSGDQEMFAGDVEDEDAVSEPAEQPRASKKGLGARLLKKQGWKPGQGLGAQGQGITRAIIVKPDKRHRDSIGGGYAGAARGTIIGGKKAKVAADDDATMETSVVKITNMLAGMDVDTEIENDLFSRIGENLTKYGTNERLFIWRESSGGNDEVFVKYNSPVSALRACQGLDGTFFSGNEMKAQLWDEDKFEKGVYA